MPLSPCKSLLINYIFHVCCYEILCQICISLGLVKCVLCDCVSVCSCLPFLIQSLVWVYGWVSVVVFHLFDLIAWFCSPQWKYISTYFWWAIFPEQNSYVIVDVAILVMNLQVFWEDRTSRVHYIKSNLDNSYRKIAKVGGGGGERKLIF